MSALQRLEQLEYRPPKAQASLIIRKELTQVRLVLHDLKDAVEQKSPLVGEDSKTKEESNNDNTTA